MKIAALDVDFNGSSFNFLRSRKPAHEGMKELSLCKSRYFIAIGQSFAKVVADRHGHAAYHNKH